MEWGSMAGFPSRYRHSASSDQNTLILIGGLPSSIEMMPFTGPNLQITSIPSEIKIYAHSSCLANNKIYTFGGVDKNTKFNSMFTFDPRNFKTNII